MGDTLHDHGCQPCKDHLGNEWASRRAMLKHYGVTEESFTSRVKDGWTLEEILTTPTRQSMLLELCNGIKYENGCYFDHLGNPYRTMRSMHRCWHVSASAFYSRLKEGRSLQASLTDNNGTTIPDVDKNIVWVFGVPYGSYKHVDAAFGFSQGQSYRHRDNLAAWLTVKGVYRADGIVFSSIVQLANAYNMNEFTVRHRVDILGWSPEEAVHTPVKRRARRIPVKDHLGNEYPSTSAMVEAYKMSYSAYMNRMRLGWSVEDALTIPVTRYKRGNNKIKDVDAACELITNALKHVLSDGVYDQLEEDLVNNFC